MNTNLIEIDNLSYYVRGKDGRTDILKNISFKLERSRTLGIAGESGSGKTTLGKLLAGIIPASEGNIRIYSDMSRSRNKINPVQVLFQNNGEILNPFRKVSDVVDEAAGILYPKKEAIEKRIKLFRALNLPDELWTRKGFELSGGEQQRAALARLLAVEPEILILDEPFSAQDPESQLNFLNLFKKIRDEFNITFICIAHNIRILRQLCDDIIIIYRGELVEAGTTGDIFDSPKHPYTKFLLSSEDYKLSYDELKENF
jgi:ABC-type dipeptide/oligopeptide/nickel transport system ATPase subunit